MAFWLSLLGRPAAHLTPELTDQLVAIDCALRITPRADIGADSYVGTEIIERAEEFTEWLHRARSEGDAHIRRTLLLMVCERAEEGSRSRPLRDLAKQLHRTVRR